LPHEPTRSVERTGEDDGGVRGSRDLQAFGGGAHGVLLSTDNWVGVVTAGEALTDAERAIALPTSSLRGVNPVLRIGLPSSGGTARSTASPPSAARRGGDTGVAARRCD